MLSCAAQSVYRVMLTEPALDVPGLVARLGLTEPDVRAALDELADESLLDAVGVASAGPDRPWLALSRAIARHEAELAERQGHLEAMRHLLEEISVDFESALQTERIVTHTSVESIRTRLEQLALGARFECLSFNPGRAQRPDAMAASKPLNQLTLERGVAIRAVYQDAFRHDPDTLAYARWLTELGGQVRTLPLVPQNLVIVDREVAFLPRTPGQPQDGAVEVRAPGIVAVLVDYFEQVWAVADPFGTAGPQHHDDGHLPALTRQVLALLATGVTDESAAHRLGLSTRTVRRLMSRAMDDLGAESRFQAGVEAVRRGWVDPSGGQASAPVA